MEANWSLVLNVVLFLGVVVAIARLMLLRNKSVEKPRSSAQENLQDADDIISIRKVSDEFTIDEDDISIKISPINADDAINSEFTVQESEQNAVQETPAGDSLMMFLSAKDGGEFAGYDLLQAILATGMRFGAGNIFHKHQNSNGQGTILFSLASATNQGTFDLQNMGSYSTRGLCMYMYLSGNKNIDAERLQLMHATAESLAETLQGLLLDDKQQHFSERSLESYSARLHQEEFSEA